MKAYYYVTNTTDLLRTGEPRINDMDTELYEGVEDFIFGARLRFMGIKEKYPSATLCASEEEGWAMITVEGFPVYFTRIVSKIDLPVEIDMTED